MDVPETFQVGTLVLAKMKGFPPWPGVITHPTEELQKSAASSKPGNHCIYFFGSKNYGWIETDKLKPYSKDDDVMKKSQRTAGGFRKACEEIEEYINKGLTVASLTNQDPFDTLVKSAKATKRKSSAEDDPVVPKKKESISSGRKSDSGEKASKTKVEVEKKKQSARLSTAGRSPHVNVSTKSATKETHKKTPRRDSVTVEKTTDSKKENQSLEKPEENYTSFTKVNDSFSFLSNSSFSRLPRAESPPLNIEKITDTLAKKDIKPSTLKFGFLGLGRMGSGLVKNLLNSNHKVTVWNRTQEKCQDFEKAGASIAITPGDVVVESDITFCCVSDNAAARDLVFGNCGVLAEISSQKAYVEMSGIDCLTSQTIADAITAAGGRYLEVRFQGSKPHSEEGNLLLMAAGDRSLYDDCNSCFSAFSISKTFLGEVGKASGMYLMLQSLFASFLLGVTEAMNQSNNAGLAKEEFLEWLDFMDMSSPFLKDKCQTALKGNINPQMPLKHLQKDLGLFLGLCDKLDLKATNVAMANEILKFCKKMGYKDLDVGAVFLAKEI